MISYFISLDNIMSPSVIKFIDAVAVFHVLAFIAIIFFFLRDSLFQDSDEIKRNQDQSKQDRKKFLTKLEELKSKEDAFKKGEQEFVEKLRARKN